MHPAERTEIAAWADMAAAVPPDFYELYRLEARFENGLFTMTSRGLHLAHFNAANTDPWTPEVLDAALETFRRAGSSKFYVHMMPEEGALAAARGLRRVSAWDRIVRPATAGEPAHAECLGVERVTSATASEWAGFIDSVYHLPAAPWLIAFAERNGWHHFALREAGAIVAARSMFIDGEQRAWWGIDAPVPGIMTDRFDRDFALCAAMLDAGWVEGAREFVSWIEKPNPSRTGPAYEGFAKLGFEVPYLRENWMP
ncbi:MAG: hypothetical protein U0Q16_32560 [Bryobacteraceae bacterium]